MSLSETADCCVRESSNVILTQQSICRRSSEVLSAEERYIYLSEDEDEDEDEAKTSSGKN